MEEKSFVRREIERIYPGIKDHFDKKNILQQE